MPQKFKPQTEIVKCNYCGKKFPRMRSICSKGRLPKGIRRKGSVTCNRRCSRQWARMPPHKRRKWFTQN